MLTIAFTGDVAFSKELQTAYENPEFISDTVFHYLNSADATVINLEGCVTDKCSTERLQHSTPLAALPTLDRLNATVWSMANNHILDWGESGVCETLNIAAENSIQTVGAGKNREDAMRPLIVGSDVKVGIVSIASPKKATPATAGNNVFLWTDEQEVLQQIKAVKEGCRWCVLLVHGGNEFAPLPFPETRKQYRRYIRYGADIVIAHHPHVVQHYEKYRNGIIFYSLGNFIFDTDYQRVQKNTDRGVIARIVFEEDHYDWDAIGTRIDRDLCRIVSCPLPAIFRNLTSLQYHVGLPVAVNSYRINRYELRRFFKKKDMPESRCLARDIRKSLDNTRIRRILLYSIVGEITPKFTAWMKYLNDSAATKQTARVLKSLSEFMVPRVINRAKRIIHHPHRK